MISTGETRAHAQDILDKIHEHPEQHNQNVWGERTDCGTTLCVAGWSVVLKGQDQWLTYTEPDGSKTEELVCATYEKAQYNLGLTSDEAINLFYNSENEEAVQKLKHIIVGEDWL